jgi:hypothetical protein
MRDGQNNGARTPYRDQKSVHSGYMDNSLADVHSKVVRFRKDFAEKVSSLDEFGWVELFHGGATAYQAMTHFAIAAEPIAVGQKDEGIFPTDELATHL